MVVKNSAIRCLKFGFVLLVGNLILCILVQYKNYLRSGSHLSLVKIVNLENLVLKHPTIFCIILTQIKNLDTRAKAVYSSWAHKCTDYRFISLVPGHDLTNERMDTVHDQMLKILKPGGLYNDTYGNLTHKVLLAFEDVYKLSPKFDWYLKADDDTLIFYDNLRDFVASKEPSEPVTYGYDFKVNVDRGYHSGGAGYLLSHEAMRRLMLKWRKRAFKGTEDVEVARILRTVNVYPASSLDNKGRERFHPLTIQDHFRGLFYDWMYRMSSNPLRNGTDCCSEQSISFHYTAPDELNKISLYLAEKKQVNNGTYAPLCFEEVYKYLQEN